ncbi:MAG TPA: hypothetical protein VJ461_06385 [Candidatus Nanoarchaeia archaeon]|nr:hypothetical protein [Candidatus Nanoarchaeia archaeon]
MYDDGIRKLSFANFFNGSICYNQKKELGIILSIELKNKKQGTYHAVGIYLDGDFDCEYRRTLVQDVTTRKGWKGSKLEMIGFIDGDDLEKAVQLADTKEHFGTEVKKK